MVARVLKAADVNATSRLTCADLSGGFLHLFFEGYYVYNHQSLASLQSIPAQIWKEYALSDSRYLTEDIFVLSIETVTMVSDRSSHRAHKLGGRQI